MSLNQITNKVNELGNAWEEFKNINDRRLAEVEKKGSADILTTNHLNRLNERISDIETSSMRPEGAKGFSVENVEHKNAFNDYIRSGEENGLKNIESKSLSASVNTDGGYLVSSQMSESIGCELEITSPMRQLANIETISKDALEVIINTSEAEAMWSLGETASHGDTLTPTIDKKIIPAHEICAQPKATQKLIDDSCIDIEEWLSRRLSQAFSRVENDGFINGDGINKPTGILYYPDGTSTGTVEQVASGVSGDVTADSIIELYYSLDEYHAVNGTFMMNRATAQAVRLLKESSTGQYLWAPGLTQGSPDTLMGRPVALSADMPIPAAGSLSVAFADFQCAYTIVDRNEITVLRDPFTDKPFVKYYTTKRVGGDITNFDAIKLLKLDV